MLVAALGGIEDSRLLGSGQIIHGVSVVVVRQAQCSLKTGLQVCNGLLSLGQSLSVGGGAVGHGDIRIVNDAADFFQGALPVLEFVLDCVVVVAGSLGFLVIVIDSLLDIFEALLLRFVFLKVYSLSIVISSRYIIFKGGDVRADALGNRPIVGSRIGFVVGNISGNIFIGSGKTVAKAFDLAQQSLPSIVVCQSGLGLCFQTYKKGFYVALFLRPVGKVLIVLHSLLEHAVDSIKFTLDFSYKAIVVRVFDGLQTVLYGIESTLESIPFSIGSSIGLQTASIEVIVCLHRCLCILNLLFVFFLVGTGVIVPDELFHLIDRLIVFGQGLLDVSENFLVAAFCIDVLDQFGNLRVVAIFFVGGLGHSLHDIVKGSNFLLQFADVSGHSFCPFSLSFGVCYGFFAFVFCFKFGKEIGNLSIEALNAFLVEIFCFRVFGTVKGSLQRIQFVSLPALCQSLVIVECLLVGLACVYFIDIGFNGLIGFRVLYATI